MKISGIVVICHRELQINILNGKPERSDLSIVSSKNGDLFMVHQTHKHPVGRKYKVKGNVGGVFSQFLNEGKATIRFIEPPHDLMIRSKPEKLKQFLKVLKLNVRSKSDVTCISDVQDSICTKLKIKLVISNEDELKQIVQYPKSLQIIEITNCGLKKLDGRILRLQGLKVLSLVNNSLESLPEHLDLLPNIKEIHLDQNCLGVGKDWRWLNNPALLDQLLVLTVDSNQITELPPCFGRFKKLYLLSLADNGLSYLPTSLGCLSTLKQLRVGQNKLAYIPSSFRFLRLDLFDISDNYCDTLNSPQVELSTTGSFRLKNKSLTDQCCTLALSLRLPFDRSIIPWTLVDYMENAGHCICRRPVLPGLVNAVVPFNFSAIALTMTFSKSGIPPLGISICSESCLHSVLNIMSAD